MNNYAFILIILLLLWLALASAFSLPVIIVGVVVVTVAIKALAESSTYWADVGRIEGLSRRLLTALVFIPVFLWEVLTSAVAVAKLAFQSTSRMQPGLVRVDTVLRSRTAITVLANLITLTPGTLTMDFDPRGWCYYIHWIDVETLDEEERAEIMIRNMERYLRRIFE